MIPLAWYGGLENDKAAVREGKGVVLHADSTVCRVLSYAKQKFCLHGYPSCAFIRMIASDAECVFRFHEVDYCAYPCYCYMQVDEEDAKALTLLYRRFCEVKNDPLFADFISTYKQSDNASTLSLEGGEGQMAIALTYNGTVLGKVSFRFRVKQVENSDSCTARVVEFNKKKFIDDIYRLMVAYGNPPALAAAKVMVNNILLDYARQMRAQGVEFDPSLFDG
jgi:hypothetical protein